MKQFFTTLFLFMLFWSATTSVRAQRTAYFGWDNDYYPFKVNFYDASPDQLLVKSRKWNFGDGSPEVTGQSNPVHYYPRKGTYVVKLTVTWDFEERSFQQEVSVGYTADFTWSKPAYQNREVNFFAQTRYADVCTNDETYSWDFGDNSGVTSTLKNPSRTFSRPGTYTVKLCVSLPNCNETYCISKPVEVSTPINNLVPSFTANTADWVTRKGLPVTFTDASTPRNEIKWWIWLFEQPRNVAGNTPVQNGIDKSYYNYRSTISHTYNRTGVFAVRLYIGNTLTYADDDDSYPLPGDEGTYIERTISVIETPEPTPGAEKTEPPPYTTRDFTLSDNFAALITASAQDFFAPQRITIYKKNGLSNSEAWDLKERWVQVNYATDTRISHMKISGSSLLLQRQPSDPTLKYFYYVIPTLGLFTDPNNGDSRRLDVDWVGDFGRLINNPSSDIPHCDMYGDEVVVVQKEANNSLYIYLVKKGVDWKNSAVTKHLISNTYTASTSNKIFIDDNAIVTKVGNQIYIFEKQGGNWNFTTKKIIDINSGDPVIDDFGYGGNTVMVTTGSTTNCKNSLNWIADVYEKPTGGWPTLMTRPSGGLLLSNDLDVNNNTKVCVQAENISVSNEIAALKVKLVNGGNTVIRKFAFKKQDGRWQWSNYPRYKFMDADPVLGVHTTDADMMNCFPSGKTEFYNYQSYCFREPYIRTSFTYNGPEFDVIRPIITLGGGNAVINANASILYKGMSIKLLPGFQAKRGSLVEIKTVNTCDELYFGE